MPMAPRRLIKGGMLFDGKNDEVRRSDILIEGETIAGVAPEIDVEAERFDATGMWITPGLIDMHVHLYTMGMDAMPLLVGNGVTTVRDVGGDTARLKQMRYDVEVGKVVGPNIIYSGPLLHEYPSRESDELRGSGPGAKPFRSDAEAVRAVNQLIDEDGVGSLKIYASVTEAVAAAILKTAEGRVPVTAHLGRTSSTFVMKRGIGGLEHLHQSIIRDIAPPHQRLESDDWVGKPGNTLRVLEAWADVDPAGPEVEAWLHTFLDSGVFLDPTIAIFAASPRADDPRLALVPASLAAVQRPVASQSAQAGWKQEREDQARANQRAVMRLIREHGGPMLVGTDLMPGALPGWSHHAEMLAQQRRGTRAIDILKATTSVSAGYLWRSDIGVVEPDRVADLAIFAGNITADVAGAASISYVVKSGRLYESQALLGIAEPDVRRYFPLDVVAGARSVLKL